MDQHCTLSDGFQAAIKDSGQLEKLAKIWLDLGYKDDALVERKSTVYTHVTGLLQEMVAEEEGVKAEKINTIENLIKESAVLGKELATTISLQCDDEVPLIDMEKRLLAQLQGFREVKRDRLHRLNAMTTEEDVFIKCLGIDRYPHPTAVPSEEHLVAFRAYLREKMHDKARLEQIFLTTRKSIIKIMNELALDADSQFEKQVVAGIDSFQLAPENMARLQELHQTMEQRFADRKALTHQLSEKLTKLWERLDEPTELRDNFVSGFVGYSSETVDALKTEIERCEQKKRENIKHFVQAVRLELEDLWKQCYFSEEQKLKFRHFYSDCFNEDLLELHEHEVTVLKNFYTENEKIFTLVSERAELWQKMVELEELASRPNRFDNRGGRLLLEERERKSIQRELPRMEKVLSKLMQKYEESKGEPFRINGEVFEQFIAKQWEDHSADKERAKLARKARNDPLGDATTRSNCKSMTSGPSVKRKVATPAAVSGAKHRRVAPPSSTAGSSAKSKMVRGLRKRDRNSRSKKVNSKIFNATAATAAAAAASKQPDLISMHNTTTDTTYADFQNYLERKPTRSSAKQCPQTTVAKRVGTPSKTPIKPALSLLQNTPGRKYVAGSSRIAASTNGTPAAKSPRYTPGRLQATPFNDRVPFRF